MKENVKLVRVEKKESMSFQTDPIYQYDSGHVLDFTSFDELPEVFEVHFANCVNGESIPQVGQNGFAPLPPQFTQTASTIFAWLYISDEETGLTKYYITIPVTPRAKITDQEPTPVERTAIEQTIAALNASAEKAANASLAIQNMGVTYETLDPDDTANIEKIVNPDTGAVTLAFSIPEGKPGAKGETGKDGEDYVITPEDMHQIAEEASELIDIDSKADKANTVITGSMSMGRTEPDASSADRYVGASSVGMGINVAAEGEAASAFGKDNEAYGKYSHAEGRGNYAGGEGAHAEGIGSNTPSGHIPPSIVTAFRPDDVQYTPGATGRASHSEGMDTGASGSASHAEGNASIARGNNSHAEGSMTLATGYHSHAEGEGTIASGNASHAEGRYNYDRTYATLPYPEWVSGESYNVDDIVKYENNIRICVIENSDTTFTYWKWKTVPVAYLHMIGNGTGYSDLLRSNAFAVDALGNGYFNGDVYVRTNKRGINGKILATSEEVQAVDDRIDDMSKATQQDIGRLLSPKTVSNGKVIEWQFVEDKRGAILHICSSGEYDAETGVPTIQDPDESIFYLVPDASENASDMFVEWIYAAGAWEIFGSARIDLSDYATKTEVNAAIQNVDGKVDRLSNEVGRKIDDVQVNGSSIVENGVANLPCANPSSPGVAKVASAGTYGLQMLTSGTTIGVYPAESNDVKNGTHVYRPVTPNKQHESAFYGLAKAAGDTTQGSSANAVGKYTDQAKTAIQEMLGIDFGLSVLNGLICATYEEESA